MALNEALRLIIDADTKGAVQGFDRMGKAAAQNLKKSQKGIDKFAGSMTKVGVGMVATGAILVGGLVKAAKASEEAAASTRKLENSVKNNASLAGHSAKEFTDLAQAIQKKTAADADDIIAGQAVMAQSKLQADQIKTLTPLVVDFARKKGFDEVTAFTLATKAASGNVTALKRSGIQVDETLAKTDAYKATVDALKGSVGGFAEEEGKTFAGSLERMKNQLGDIEEGVGAGAVQAFSKLLGPVEKLSGAFAELDPQTQSMVGQIGAFGAAGLIAVGGLSFVVGKAITMRDNLKTAKDAVGGLISSLRNVKGGGLAFGAGIGIATVALVAYMDKQKKFRAEVKELRDEAEQTGQTIAAAGLRKMIDEFAESDEVANSLGRLSLSIKDLREPLQGTSAEFDAWGKSLRANTDQTADAQQAAGILIGRVGALRDQIGSAEAQEKTATTATKELGLESAATGDQLENKLAPSLEDTAAQTKALGDSTRDLNSALHAQIDPLFAAQDAAIRLKDAQAAVATATKEHGAKSAEAAEANRDAARAALGYESSLVTLDAAVRDGSVNIEDAKATVRRWADAGYISRDAAAQAAGAFGRYADSAKKIPKAVSTTVTTPGLAAAQAAADRMLATVRQLGSFAAVARETYSGPSGGSISGGTTRRKAMGGPIYAAQGMFTPRGTDTVPAMLTPGEFVIRKKAVDKYGLSTMQAINEGRVPATGGGQMAFPTHVTLVVDGQQFAARIVADGTAKAARRGVKV